VKKKRNTTERWKGMKAAPASLSYRFENRHKAKKKGLSCHTENYVPVAVLEDETLAIRAALEHTQVRSYLCKPGRRDDMSSSGLRLNKQ
jgi:hypothetical protein